VLALPYHLMITYSGLVLSLFVYMPAVPLAVYGENQQPLFQEVNGSSTPPMLPEAPEAAMKPLLPMLDAAQHLSGRQANMVVIRNYGHANADVNVALLSASDIADTADMVSFSATTGERLEGNGMDVVTARPTLASARFRDLLVNLHLALFAGPFLRVLFVLSGLGGTALMGTGLLLWTKKRKAQLKHGTQAHLGIAVVDRLNVGTIVGLPIAIAAYFWGNRLLPLREEILGIHRHDLEADVMFFTWAVLLLYPIWRPLQRAWVEMLALGAFAYAFIPVLNALTTNRNLAVSLAQKDWVMAGFDLAALAVGILFGCLAWRLRRKATAPHQLPLQPEPI
ncbi:MAG TPA: PepSY-associated TM helix domain-containing protein, partial [Hyphomicrobiales bacterium]|nr:PepSY-associated TM helix domain-containing protein [Hyphomicrobiales bacterium]